MKINNTWIGIAFVAFSIYKSITGGDILESTLYASVGIGFVLMDAVMDAVKMERFAEYKRLLTILSWIFVLAGILLFIAVLRKDAYGL